MAAPIIEDDSQIATHRLFGIPEIVESILLRTPPADVQTSCRGVCCMWKALIETSPALVYYTRTGLRLREDAGAIRTHGTPSITPLEEFPTPEKTGVITPMAIQVLAAFWRRLAPNIFDANPDPRNELSLESDAQRRVDLARASKSTIESKFRGIAERTPLLHPGFELKHISEAPSEWGISNSSHLVHKMLPSFPAPAGFPHPIDYIMRKLVTTVTLYSRPSPALGSRVPLRADGYKRRHLLLEITYLADSQEIEAVEAHRKIQEWYTEREIARGIIEWVSQHSAFDRRPSTYFGSVWGSDHMDFAAVYKLPLDRPHDDKRAEFPIRNEGTDDPMRSSFRQPFSEFIYFEAQEPYDVEVTLKPRMWPTLSRRYRDDGPRRINTVSF
ncbi:hypothetical protein ABW21_db0208876 [Orbilia brochopaga]|nr:hypothetical protein ABW21_db0208876 [Drechslerella brochopaga]